ncbi:MAG: hypothetical protein R6U38_08005, partial [Desulfatiglandaceae bacterium]
IRLLDSINFYGQGDAGLDFIDGPDFPPIQGDTGTTAKDAFLTITETAKKLGVNAFKYINVRVSRILSEIEVKSRENVSKKGSEVLGFPPCGIFDRG